MSRRQTQRRQYLHRSNTKYAEGDNKDDIIKDIREIIKKEEDEENEELKEYINEIGLETVKDVKFLIEHKDETEPEKFLSEILFKIKDGNRKLEFLKLIKNSSRSASSSGGKRRRNSRKRRTNKKRRHNKN